MKRLLILLILMTSITTLSFSKNILKDTIITESQIKTVNLIFAEHQKLTIENNLLKQQLSNYKEFNALQTRIDSVKIAEAERQTKRAKKKVRVWQISSILLVVLLLIK